MRDSTIHGSGVKSSCCFPRTHIYKPISGTNQVCPWRFAPIESPAHKNKNFSSASGKGDRAASGGGVLVRSKQGSITLLFSKTIIKNAVIRILWGTILTNEKVYLMQLTHMLMKRNDRAGEKLFAIGKRSLEFDPSSQSCILLSTHEADTKYCNFLAHHRLTRARMWGLHKKYPVDTK